MKIQLNRELFEKKLRLAIDAMATKTILPILYNALIEMSEDEMRITSSDNEITVSTKLKCDTDGDVFDFVCDIKSIFGVISNLKSEDVLLEVGDKEVTLKTPRTRKKYVIPVFYSPSDFPKNKSEKWNFITKVNGSVLSSMIKKSLFLVNSNDLRKGLAGINITVKPGSFVAQSTNGAGLFKGSIIDESIEGDLSIMVPRSISKVVNGYEKSPEVEIFIDDVKKNIMIKDGGSTTFCVLVDGAFPDTSPFFNNIPQGCSLVVNKESLSMAIKRVQVFKDSGTNGIIFNNDGDNLLLQAEDKGFSKSAEEIVELSKKEDALNFKTAFRFDLITNTLGNLSGENITVIQKDDRSQAFFSDDSSEGFETIYLIMPIAIGNDETK